MNLLLTLTTYEFALPVALPFTILVLAIASYIPSIKNSANKTIQFCRWLLIIAAILNLIFLLIGYIKGDSLQYYFGANGNTYLFTAFCACILPFILLHKWIGQKTIFIFLVSIFLKIGSHLEIYTIILSRYFQNYQETSLIEIPLSFFTAYSNYIWTGFITAIFILASTAFYTYRDSLEAPLDSVLSKGE